MEPRTLLATIPAATATGAPVNLSGLSSVTTNGNANSPAVVVDPYDSQKVFAVWGVDLSTLSPVPHTTAVVEGAYSSNGGASWTSLGDDVAFPQLDVATINANPPTAYAQVTDPTVAFDGQGNVYVLTLQNSGANDGALYLTEFNFSGSSPSLDSLPNNGIVYQWVAGSDAATSPVVAVDTANPAAPGTSDPHANNVYIAWASIDTEPANANPYIGPGFNPNRAELVVGTPITNPSGNEQSLAFSGVTTVSANGNYGPNDNSHPQLVINQNAGGQITVAWDDFGTGSKASPAYDILDSSLVQAGDTYGFDGATGYIQPGAAGATSGTTVPGLSTYDDTVNVPDPGAVNNLTVAVDLTDQASVSNLNLTLFAPNGDEITLVQNQIDATGKAHTSQGLPSGNAIGQFGFTTGTTGTPGISVGTIFDDNATRNIFDPNTANPVGSGNSATDYIGYFRPEGGSLKSFIASLGGDINGTWTLEITNYSSANPAFGELNEFNLQFSTGMTASGPSTIDTTLVTGALGNTFARAVPSTPNGVGPGLVLGIDNTLGPDSPYQGRIYAAYVGYEPNTDPNQHVNPTTNTDIYLAYSDNGGQSWVPVGVVNDDAATSDGYSGSSIDSESAYTSGRTQFQPEIAVDQSTGTLVISWRDARDDAANARVATYITTSIDGGQTFSAQTYANPQYTAVDAITGQTDVLGPESDNQSGGNPQRDTTFGYGNQMGLAVLDGQLYPVWAGNFNAAYLVNKTTVTAYPLNIWYRPMVIATGPRIISSSMGPIPLAEAASGSVSISVTFDRPVNPATFVPGDVQVFFHDTTNGDPSVPLTVTGVTPVAGSGSGPGDDYGYTQFTITFNPTPAGAAQPYNYTGTYRYLIAPDNGSGLAISSPIETYIGTTLRTGDPMDQNADGTPDENAVTTSFIGTTPGDVYAVPTPQPGTSIEFSGAKSILSPPFNQNTLPLIVPGPQVLATSVPGGDSANGNLITDGTTSTLSVTFDRPMQVSTFTPAQIVQIMGPTGPVSGPWTVTPVSPVGGLATTFTIGFPLQQLSGTYTIQLGPTIEDTFGDQLDTNQNAGLAVLRDQGQNSPTTTVHYTAGDLPKAIPAPTGTTPGQVTSTIAVPDSFIIEGDKTAAGASVMQVQISLTYPTDADLTATLTHYGQGNVNLGQVTLFSGVGAGPTTANFNNTVFDDNAATPIQSGSAPFFSTFNPQQSLATIFAPASGMSVQGTWVLTIVNNSKTGGTGTITNWSLTFQKPQPTSGLGEPGSDDVTASFRIFTLSQEDALSSQAWTAVGPASIGGSSSTPGGDPSGRVTGLAIDPSDPSGNTVYAAGASGGIWKTTDFLTTNAAGPTWIPLTDFGPTSGVNIGGIAVFPRNDNPNQSIIIAATGEGDTGTPGVGFLISDDGGATWNLYDSTDNVDSSGNVLPISSASRDRVFVGDSAFQVTVDPKATPSGQVIIYAALSGPTGGIWRSENTGQTWQLMMSGQATSVVLDQESGTVLDPDTNTEVQGNLQVVYAAIRGVGIFMSPNQGQVWNQMLGGIGNPLIFDSRYGPSPNVNPVNGLTPTGAEGRISLAVPNPTGNAAQDAVYEGWLYAIVSTPAGALDGIFVTKDFGQNWTQVRIPTEPNQGYLTNPAIPANDVGLADFPIIGSTQFPQGNYNQAIAVDPSDPSIIYVGGTADGNETGLIRINLTDIWDAHSLAAYSDSANDGGALNLNSTGPAAVADKTIASSTVNGQVSNVDPSSYLNYIRNPGDPFVGNASLSVYNYSQFTNNGAGVEWIPFDVGGTDYHRIVTMVDPTTGLPRLIFGNDQGIWSVLDNNGTFETQIGSSDMLPATSRNGNLQITQFYYGAAQPSNAAALIAGSLFYGSAQDNGGPSSVAGVISNGNIVWNGPGGDAAGVATDQQGTGTLYQYFWPCCGGGDTDFFQVDGTGRTSGLLQASGGQPTPDPQWPFTGGANFAVDPVNGQDIVISSATGNIFTTTNQGVTWFDVGEPSVFNNPGSFSVALAYGAPDPSAPAGVGNLGNFIYVGTAKGQIYVTQDGGGSGSSNNWLNISLGLDGSPVESIITDPTRGSHDAYAVTRTGVFYLADSVLLGNNPANTAYEWVNITGNLKTLAYSIFGQAYNPGTDPNSTKYNQAVSLSSIVADWRYAIPNSPTYANGPAYHPVLYVGSGNSSGTGSGVYQSVDGGQTWTYFPDTTYGAVVEGGYLPHVAVTSLSLSLGDTNVDTGMTTLDGPYAPAASNRTAASAADPDTLMAATYGQGEFAINLAPLILGDEVTVSPTTAGTGTASSPVVTGPITISGSSEISGFGNATWITVEDVTNPAVPRVIAGFNPADPVPTPNSSNSTNALGNFAIPFNPASYYMTNGPKKIEIFATDNAGSVGNVVTYSFTLNDPNLPTPTPTPTPLIAPTVGFASGSSVTVRGIIYAIGRQPWFVGTTSPGVTVDLILGGKLVIEGAKIVGVVVTNAAGDFSFHLPAGIKNGRYTMEARALSPSGSSYKLSVPVAFRVGPTPHIKPARKPPAKPKPTKPVKAVTSKRKVVQVQSRAVQADQTVTTSGSNGHLIDQAVHTLVEERLFKKKGH